ncbi:MAG: hypothetical protein ACJASD_001123 [Sphingomonas echinoides]|jgi:hypothetical protein
MLANASACDRKEPVICRTSPPERSEDYQRWADDVTAAHCKHLRMEPAPPAREAATTNVR